MSISADIIDRASEWFVTMRDPATATKEAVRFADWLRASPLHVQAYLEIAKLWGHSAHIDAALPAIQSDPPVAQVVTMHNGGAAVARSAGSTRTRRSRWMALAASLACAAVVTAVLWSSAPQAEFATAVGEQRRVTLVDGSVVQMNAKSRFTVTFTDALRRVDLIEGQALFEVARDPVRPFVVHSGSAAVRAVGTRFDVYRKPSGTLVSVVQGRVAVSGTEPEVLLGAGEQITVTHDGSLSRPEKPNVVAATSWLEQKLSFDGEPLAEVLAEFNRHTRTPIVLSDPSLSALRVNAVFQTTSPESLLRFIERFEGVTIERGGEEIRILREKSHSQ